MSLSKFITVHIPSNRTDPRTAARFLALQTLYEIDVTAHDPMEVLLRHIRDMNEDPSLRPAPYTVALARVLVHGVIGQREALDQVIEQRAPDFPVASLAVIDRNVLRMALYEFAVWSGTPVGAAIDQAVELAKEFSGEGAPGFVNGVLRSAAVDSALMTALHKLPRSERETEAIAALSATVLPEG